MGQLVFDALEDNQIEVFGRGGFEQIHDLQGISFNFLCFHVFRPVLVEIVSGISKQDLVEPGIGFDLHQILQATKPILQNLNHLMFKSLHHMAFNSIINGLEIQFSSRILDLLPQLLQIADSIFLLVVVDG